MSSSKSAKEKLYEPDGNLWNFFAWYGVHAANLWKLKKQLDEFKPIKSYARIAIRRTVPSRIQLILRSSIKF